MQKTNRKDVIVIMKKVLAIFFVSVAIILICIMTSTKSKLPGSWYCVSDPDEYIIIHKNGQVEMSDDGTYTYEYKKGTISFIPDNEWLYNTITAEVKIKGDIMYLDFGNYTKQYCNSYDKAFEEYSKQYPEEYEADIEQEKEAEENFQQYVMTESMPQPGAVQTAVESMGYDVFEYTGRDQYVEENDIYDNDLLHPTVIYYFDIIGSVERMAVYYEYHYGNLDADNKWNLSYIYEYTDGDWVTTYDWRDEDDESTQLEENDSETNSSRIYWKQKFYVDEFKDSTEDWYITTCEYLEGTYENSETNNSPLLAELTYDYNDYIMIYLYEDADFDCKVKNGEQEKCYYKIIIKNEDDEKYEARGQMHPGGDRIYVIDAYDDTVFEMMKNSRELKFYIEQENAPAAQYRFNVDMSDFIVVLDECGKLN